MDGPKMCGLLQCMIEEIARQPRRPAPVPGILHDFFQYLIADARRHAVPFSEEGGGPWQATPYVSETTGGPMAPGTLVRCGLFSMLVHGAAAELAALLNWCKVPEPVQQELLGY